MKKLIDRTEEKIELAKELGLNYYFENKLRQIEEKKTIDELTGMKFMPIGHKEIARKLRSFYFHGLDFDDCDWIIPTASISAIVSLFIDWPLSYAYPEASKFLFGICALIATVPAAISTVRISNVKNMKLKNWPWEIPYGALLAVKEAKEKGIDDFEIHYPTRVGYTSIRLLTDPVITGQKNNIQVEVFAWDDRKVYE